MSKSVSMLLFPEELNYFNNQFLDLHTDVLGQLKLQEYLQKQRYLKYF